MVKNFLLKFFATFVVVCFLGLAYSCSDDDVVEAVPDDNGEQVDPNGNEEPNNDEPEVPDDPNSGDEDEEEPEPENPAGDDGIMKILCIGNSFSRDAVEQNLWELFHEVGTEAVIGNLYIGGCSLQTHYENTLSDAADYSYRKVVNGVKTTLDNYTMLRGILDEDWDYISLQQSSPLSGVYSTYNPYLPRLIDYVLSNATNKKVKIVFHQTWAYSYSYSSSQYSSYYHSDQMEMYNAIMDAVQTAVQDNEEISIVVPCGTAVQNARNTYMGDNLNSDGRHLETTYGRFLAACTWFETLSGIDVTTTTVNPAGIDAETRDLVVHAAHFAVEKPYEIDDMVDWQGDGDTTEEEEDYSDYTITVSDFRNGPTTVTVSWDLNGLGDNGTIEYPYRVALYSDANCSNLVVGWDIEDSTSAFKPGSTARIRFTFAGLEPSTDYWVKVSLLDDETVCSEPFKTTTAAEFAYKVTATSNAGVGDVIAVQDFDKLIHGGDIYNRSAGLVPEKSNRTSLGTLTGDNPSGYTIYDYHSSGSGFAPFPSSGNGVSLEYTKAAGLEGWCTGVLASNGYEITGRPGNLKVGRSSNMGYIATPELSAIPEGKTATLKVDFQAMPSHYGSTWYAQNMYVDVVDNVVVDSSTMQVSAWGATSDDAEIISQADVELVQDDEDYQNYSVTLTGATSTSRVRLHSYSSSKPIFILDNVVVTITEIN